MKLIAVHLNPQPKTQTPNLHQIDPSRIRAVEEFNATADFEVRRKPACLQHVLGGLCPAVGRGLMTACACSRGWWGIHAIMHT